MGFKIYDDMKSTDDNVFQFTVNVKLIHEEEDGSYMVRIPYDTQYVRVEPEEFEWLTEDKTARITIPIDKDVSVFDSSMTYKGLKDAEELKRLFEDKTKGKRKGLRIRMPESKYIVRTNRLEPNEDGLGYTLEDVMQRINNNGRIINTQDIQSAMDSQGDFDKVMQARRNLYESANVKFDPTTTLFKSVRQESYFRWKATEVQKVMDRMNYRNLLQHDRENIDKLKSRRYELQKQIDEVNHLLENVDNTVEMMIKQKIENAINENNTTIINKVDKSVDVKIAENNKAINNTINNVNVRVDGIKGDLNGLTKRVDQNEKDINVAGTIAMENRTFIGNNKAAIDKNTKAIEALNGKVGTTITNIESTINNKIEANNTTILNKVDQNIDAKITANNTTIINKVDKNIDVKINENNKQINNTINTKIGDVNVKIDGVKGDVAGLTKRVDRHDERLDYLEGNTVDNSTRISANEDAIKALKGQVGTTVTNVENTINAKIEANNTVIRNDINTAITNNNTVINNNIALTK